jgi:hypothetical protein
MSYDAKINQGYIDREGNQVTVTEVTGNWPKMVVFHPAGNPSDQQEMKLYEFKRMYRLVQVPVLEDSKAKRISYRLYPGEIKMLSELGKVHGDKTTALRLAIKEAHERTFS